MKRPLPDIKETALELKALMQQEKDARKKLRLQVLYLAQSGICKTRQSIALSLSLHRNTVSRWFRIYQSGGLEKLKSIAQPLPPKGQKTLPSDVLQSLREQLSQPTGFASYVEIQEWIEKQHGIKVSYFTLYKIVRYHLKAKLKVSRRSHVKKTMSKSRSSRMSCPTSL